MNQESTIGQSLDAAITDIYAGPLDGFVGRREALVKTLRSAGQRDAAAAVKGLRKPSRLAWALNVAALGTPGAVDRIAEAVDTTVAAQAGGGDLRASLSALREMVRLLADAAAHAAEAGGVSAQPADLVNAVMAIIGAPSAFELLRKGRLQDVPEAGGIDFPAASPAGSERARAASSEATEDTERERARSGRRLLEESVAAARADVVSAERALSVAEVDLEEAERRLALARHETDTRRSAWERAKDAVRMAVSDLERAEKALVGDND